MPVTTSAEDFLPSRLNLTALRQQRPSTARVATCIRTPLKPSSAKVLAERSMILLGEVPGDEEDKQGKPFVGPAGRLLDESLEEAGISRDEVYITNAVKHFRWEPRGKRRLHKKPTWRQIEACRPWLQAEILVIKPEVHRLLGRHRRPNHARPRFSAHQAPRQILPRRRSQLDHRHLSSIGNSPRTGKGRSRTYACRVRRRPASRGRAIATTASRTK